jgi:chromate transporter
MDGQAQPTFAEMVRVFARIGCLSFGGPAGQIALMHREIVEQRGWVDDAQYLSALNFCHLLPGPEAQQLATWIGWRLHGVRGGLVAGLLFVVPGALVILALSVLYAAAAQLDWFAAVFLGIKAAVLAIVLQALMRIAGRALNTRFKLVLAATAFAALFLFALPFPVIVVGAAAIGWFAGRVYPDWLALPPVKPAAQMTAAPWRETLRTIAIWLPIWALPLAVIYASLGPKHVLWDIGIFFSQLAVVTFGGAYAVLAYMAQEAVQGFGWLSAGEMADGLGLAETTPGPLILVTQFVGYLAAFRNPDPFASIVAGMLGAGLTIWVTFVPCFLWIFAAGPWMERLQHAPRLRSSLAALTAAIVGVIANLATWFSLHLLFGTMDQTSVGPLRLYLPDWASLNMNAAILAAGSALLLFRFKWPVPAVLAAAGAGGLALSRVAGFF